MFVIASSETLIFIIMSAALLGVALTALFYCTYVYKLKRKVKNESARYGYLSEVDADLNYNRLHDLYSFRICFDSKSKYDNANPGRSIIEYIKQNPNILKIVSEGLTNKQILPEFRKRVDRAPAYRKDAPERLYDKIERKMVCQLLEELIPKVPQFEFIFSYTSPAGRNHYEKTYTISIDQIVGYIREMRKMEEEKLTTQYQRKIMTPKLRYNVMKRDHFRCVLCGRSARDGTELEVDHIKPVSKGGLTEMSNLRTLCKDCNRGKRDRYDEDGLN